MSTGEDRWERADRILDAALDLAIADRPAFLDRECGDDRELRALVDRLLRAAETGGGFVTPGGGVGGTDWGHAIDEAVEDDGSRLEGAVLDRYRIVREVGRGGMAVVYLAERADGQFEQRVALKIVKRGIDTDEVVARFTQERQIQARIQHPGIAGLIDGGVTPDGRPYFVMEFVDGQPIDGYCDARELDVEDRLRLFLQVGRAVAFAHRNLVVHRDLKPSNILVTERGEARLMDFGIAKTLDPGEDASQATVTHARFMTPAYASPEQIRGQPVTTASDVYQLGVLLYVLLVGALPYRRSTDDPGALMASICEDPPTRPSTVRRALRGDLDNILLKALRKEPERRYESVGQFLEDIERYLEGHPVGARPDTLWYRTGKFVRRHKLAVASGVAAVVVITALVGFYTTRLRDERNRAVEALDSTQEVSEFLVGLFEVADPGEARGRSITAEEILQKGAERVRNELADRPAIQARMMHTIGMVYLNLGLYDEAVAMLDPALEIRRDLLEPGDPDIAVSLNDLGKLRSRQGRFEEAEALFREALAIREARFGPVHPAVAESVGDLGATLMVGRDPDGAEPLLRRAIEIYQATEGLESSHTAGAINNLGVLYHNQRRYAEAEPLYLRAIEIQRRLMGPDHPLVITTLHNIAGAQAQLGRIDEAEQTFEQAREAIGRVMGETHPQYIMTLSNIAWVYGLQGRLDEAEALHLRTLRMREELLGPDHIDVSHVLGKLALLYQQQDRIADALAVQTRMNRIREQALGPDNPRLIRTTALEGEFERLLGNPDAAGERFRRSMRIAETAAGPDSLEVTYGRIGLARLARDRGDLADARKLYTEIEAARSDVLPDEDPRVVEVRDEIAALPSG